MPHERSFGLRILAEQHGKSMGALLQSFPVTDFIDTSASLLARVEKFLSEASAVEIDAGLSLFGKRSRLAELGKLALSDVQKWGEQRTAFLETKRALAKTFQDTATQPKATPEQVQAMRDRISALGPNEIEMAYRTGTQREQLALEGVAALTPRLPIKTDYGVRWVSFLPAELVEQTRAARLAESAPTAAAMIEDLEALEHAFRVCAATAEKTVTDFLAADGVQLPAQPSKLKDPRTGVALRFPEPPTAA